VTGYISNTVAPLWALPTSGISVRVVLVVTGCPPKRRRLTSGSMLLEHAITVSMTKSIAVPLVPARPTSFEVGLFFLYPTNPRYFSHATSCLTRPKPPTCRPPTAPRTHRPTCTNIQHLFLQVHLFCCADYSCVYPIHGSLVSAAIYIRGRKNLLRKILLT
jgi:hypothetical protein